MTFFFIAVNVGFLFFISHRVWKAERSVLKIFFWPALTLKFAAGICIGLIYSYYYTAGDTFTYFYDGVKLADLARTDPLLYLRFLWMGDNSFDIWSNLNLLQSRALFMVKLTSVVNLISHNNYWITTLYFSFVSFITAWTAAKAIVRLDPSLLYAAALGFLLFPSVVFWSSGLIKECLAMASLFFLTSIFVKGWLRERLPLWDWILIPVCLWLVWSLKYYYLAVFLPLGFAGLVFRYFFDERLKFQPLISRILTWCVVFLIPVVAVSLVRPNFYPERFLNVIISNYEEFHAISNADDLIYYDKLAPTVGSILRNSPWALISGLFRPFPWEAGTVFQIFISIENIFLLILACAALSNVPKMIRSPNRLLLFSLVLYVAILGIFLALSTPNFGTLSRYRVGFLPFFVFLITIENPIVTRLTRLVERSSDHLVR